MIGAEAMPFNRAVDRLSGHPTITWLGHATVLIELDGVRLLTDPVLRDRIGPLVRISPPVATGSLGRIDCVLLSHLHADHADLRSLRDVARNVHLLAPHAAAAWLRRRGLRDVRGLRPGERERVGGLSIYATRAVHDRRRRPLGPKAEPIGFLTEGSVSMYFAGDTDLFGDMADLRNAVDVALLPVWGWGKRLGPGHLDPDRAARAAAMIAPRTAIPIHWGTFALGWPAQRPKDPRLPSREFAALMRRYAPNVDVRLLAPGDRTLI
jgi:L-ascorbate metabolism protein UlaG (beta-lactamase superfamily)